MQISDSVEGRHTVSTRSLLAANFYSTVRLNSETLQQPHV